MKKLAYLLLLTITYLGCAENKIDTTVNLESKTTTEDSLTSEAPVILYAERSRLFASYSTEKLAVADFIDEYLNIMYDSTQKIRNFYWDSAILIQEQDYFLKSGFDRNFLEHVPPKLLGIQQLKNNTFLAKVAYSEGAFPYKIMNLKIAKDGLGRFYFIDQLGENLSNFDKKEVKSCTFYYSQKVAKNKALEQKTIDFNQKMASFFNINAKAVKIIALKDIRDYCDALGYEYSTILTYDAQTGGIAMPKEDIIFSANNSPYYPHELVHLYTSHFNAHYWFDEGLATYFGGSVEYPLEHHLKKIANQMDSLNFSELPTDKKLDDDTSFKYAIGGLLCKLAMEEFGGKDTLMQLLNSGKSEEDFHSIMKNTFGVKKENYDTFIKEKLEQYNT